MKITILGTSSAVPLPNRNLSGTLLHYENEYVLFDCGEGTQFHLKKLAIHTGRIRVICITHLHGDHVFGLLGLLSGLYFGDDSVVLTLIGPRGLKSILDISLQNQQFFIGYKYQIIELDFIEIPNKIFETDRYEIQSVSLDHRIPAFGYRFQEKDRAGSVNLDKVELHGIEVGPKLKELKKGNSVQAKDGHWVSPEEILDPPKIGKSFCYLTDTRYCERTIKLAEQSNLIMHESTYLEEMKEKAIQTGHSTSLDAGKIAKSANVGKLILFHFSSRYVRLKPLLNEAKSVFENTIVGKDLESYEI